MRVDTIQLIPTLLMLAMLSAAPALAESEDPNLGRWVPAFAIDTGVRAMTVDATVSSVQRGDFKGDATVVFGFIGGSAQLTSPAWFDLPGKPRFFLRAGAANSFDGREQIVNEGGVGNPVIPIIDNDGDGIGDVEPVVIAVTGQGSATSSKTKPLIFTGAVGIDFIAEIGERKVHFKPSLEWLFQEEEIRGMLGYAESTNTDPDEMEVCPCRTAYINATETRGFHSIGPGLEIEVDASRLGPFVMSVYAGGQAYYVFSREYTMIGMGEFSDGSSTISLESTYERDRWDYRVGVGVRLHWLPE